MFVFLIQKTFYKDVVESVALSNITLNRKQLSKILIKYNNLDKILRQISFFKICLRKKFNIQSLKKQESLLHSLMFCLDGDIRDLFGCLGLGEEVNGMLKSLRQSASLSQCDHRYSFQGQNIQNDIQIQFVISTLSPDN